MAWYRPMAGLALGVLGGGAFTGLVAVAAALLAGAPAAVRVLQGGGVGTAAGVCVGAVVSLACAAGRRAEPGAAAGTAAR